jgi:valyl-tRNA synthetase
MLAEIKRCQGLLNNPGFMSKAPQDKIEAEKEKLKNYQEQLLEIEKLLKEYSA